MHKSHRKDSNCDTKKPKFAMGGVAKIRLGMSNKDGAPKGCKVKRAY